ncbi:MAG TPA: GTPase CgtA, partial [Clostridiaceae bacterium]|nr:GTPase CgtA [Clostridiaceae bacterium]
EKYVPRGGPDGGDAGRGGNVIFEVDTEIRTLLDFRYKKKYTAIRGEDGGTNNCHGADGKDLVIKVPQGTMIKDGETNELIADLTKKGQRVVA